jgi:hypothetical protein
MILDRRGDLLADGRERKSMPAISTMVSSRAMTSRALLACTVVNDPSCPVFMACSMSSASPPRHLAHDDPVGTHAQRIAHQVADGDLAALAVGGPGLEPDQIGVVQREFGRISMVTRRRAAG